MPVEMKLKSFTASTSDYPNHLVLDFIYNNNQIEKMKGKIYDSSTDDYTYSETLYVDGKPDSAYVIEDTNIAMFKYVYLQNEFLYLRYFPTGDSFLIDTTHFTTNADDKVTEALIDDEVIAKYIWDDGNCVEVNFPENGNAINYSSDNNPNPMKGIFITISWTSPMFFNTNNSVIRITYDNGNLVNYQYEYNNNGYPTDCISDMGNVPVSYKYEYY